MSKRIQLSSLGLILALAALVLAAAPAAADDQPCGSIGIFDIQFGAGVPYESVEIVDGTCYCGVKNGVSHQQAMENG